MESSSPDPSPALSLLQTQSLAAQTKVPPDTSTQIPPEHFARDTTRARDSRHQYPPHPRQLDPPENLHPVAKKSPPDPPPIPSPAPSAPRTTCTPNTAAPPQK